jgi:predicted RNA binding protein YcfA (HicA-like mRNA interferase family)
LGAPYAQSLLNDLLSELPKILTFFAQCVSLHIVDSRSIIKILKQNGWHQVATSGSHTQFRHPKIKGRVTVPHPKKDIPIGTLKSIERQSGIKFN